MPGTKGRSGGKRPPKLLEYKKRDGTLRKDRVNPEVPDPVPAVPQMPELSGEAAERWWAFWVALLGPEGRNVLTLADGPGLAEICELQVELLRRRKEQKGGVAVMSGRLSAWMALYGVTPADRQRIPAVAPAGPKKKALKPLGGK